MAVGVLEQFVCLAIESADHRKKVPPQCAHAGQEPVSRFQMKILGDIIGWDLPFSDLYGLLIGNNVGPVLSARIHQKKIHLRNP